MEERELINRAKSDIKAFDELYRLYYPKINKFVYYRTFDEDVRNEIVSNVFFKAMKNLNRFRFLDSHRSSFSAWLYRIAVSEINQYFRERKRELKIAYGKHNEVPVENMEYPYQFEYVKKCLAQLAPYEQNLIALKYFEKKPYKELSEIFGKKESALKVKVHRTLKKLNNILEQENGHENDRRYA
ncbi:MAG: sigma-70 family RNA polymerase sigma factor [Candidatus Cloacimonetes bacterium]|nr:sigma-70 family RNA polymerase sigma factor [Candidatus Cloacimonadota bacterium]